MKSMLMKTNSSKIKEQKFNFKRIEDSLILILKASVPSLKKNSKSLKAFNYVEDREVSITTKIHMPLKKWNRCYFSFWYPNSSNLWNAQDAQRCRYKSVLQKVYAVMDGVVTDSGWDSKKGGGNYIRINILTPLSPPICTYQKFTIKLVKL